MSQPNDKPYLAYESIAEDYASEQDDPKMRDRCRTMFLDLLRGKRVLELGCGPGHDGAKLQEAGCNVTSIDLCESFLEYGRRTYPDVDFQCMDIEEPSFESNTFDGIFGMACFCHVPKENVKKALGNYLDILQTGGSLFLCQGDSEQVDGYVVDDWGGIEGNKVEIFCHHRDVLKTSLEEVGFDEIQVTHIDCPFYEEMPRLKKNGIRMYAITAKKP